VGYRCAIAARILAAKCAGEILPSEMGFVKICALAVWWIGWLEKKVNLVVIAQISEADQNCEKMGIKGILG
jgi:hypothetical protein